jgi:hypothetical protein
MVAEFHSLRKDWQRWSDAERRMAKLVLLATVLATLALI